MSILNKLNKALEKAEPNVLGNRYVKIEVGGDTYLAAATTVGSHQSANCWGRTDYKKNGKKIAKANLV